MFSWQCFRARSVDDGAAIPSGSSTALRFQFLSFILVPTFFWLDCFNRDAFLVDQPLVFFSAPLLKGDCSLLSAGVYFYVLCCLLHVLMDQVDAFLIAQSMKVASWKSFNRAFFPGSSHQLFFLKYSIIRNHE